MDFKLGNSNKNVKSKRRAGNMHYRRNYSRDKSVKVNNDDDTTTHRQDTYNDGGKQYNN